MEYMDHQAKSMSLASIFFETFHIFCAQNSYRGSSCPYEDARYTFIIMLSLLFMHGGREGQNLDFVTYFFCMAPRTITEAVGSADQLNWVDISSHI